MPQYSAPTPRHFIKIRQLHNYLINSKIKILNNVNFDTRKLLLYMELKQSEMSMRIAVSILALTASSMDLWTASNAYYMDEPISQQAAYSDVGLSLSYTQQITGCLCSGIQDDVSLSGNHGGIFLSGTANL
jgi:hypothetical protein